MLTIQILTGLGIVVVLGLLVTVIWYGTRVQSLQINSIEVVGGYTIPHSEIETKVQERLIGTYFKLIPKSFRATYPKNAILENIYSIARVKNVAIEVLDTQKIVIVFEEYRPHALWCEFQDSPECLFLDDSGYAFSQAPILTGSAFIRYVDEDTLPEIKTQGFAPDFIHQTQEFSDLLATQLDLYVTHVEKVQDLDILYTVSGGGVLKVSQSMTPETSFKNLRSILSSENFIHLQNGAFQYIDLRFGDKIFLNEEKQRVNTATTTE